MDPTSARPGAVPAHRRALAAAILLALTACGGGSSGPSDGMPVDAEGGDGAVIDAPVDAAASDGAPADGGVPGACGTACGRLVDPEGGSIDCGLCRYAREPWSDALGGGAHHRVALAASGSTLEVAFAADGALQSARRAGTGPWTVETITPLTGEPFALDVAEAADGSRWVVFVMPGKLTVASFAGGSWAEEVLPGTPIWASLALGASGQPMIAWSGSSTTGGTGIFLYERAGATWSQSTVATLANPGGVALAVAGDEPQVVWHDRGAATLRHAVRAGSGFVVETIDPAATPFVSDHGGIALTLDGQGAPHVAYASGSRNARYASRSGGAWQVEEVSNDWAVGDLAIAIAPDGRPRVTLWERGEGLVLAERVGAGWVRQVIANDCDDGDADLAFDAAGVLHVVLHCGGAAAHLAPVGRYPAAYGADCRDTAETLCATACTCGPECCFVGEGCISPATYCPGWITTVLCGDASQDPSLLYTCAAEAAALMCEGSELAVGPGCAPLF